MSSVVRKGNQFIEKICQFIKKIHPQRHEGVLTSYE